MLDGLSTEIAAHPEWATAGRKIILAGLNADGTAQTEAWVVRTDDHKVPKGDMLALLSLASQVKLYDWMKAESDAAKGFSLFYSSHDQFKTTDPVFRGTIQLLHDPLALITEDEQNAILRLGERSISRAEELFGRKIEKGDF